VRHLLTATLACTAIVAAVEAAQAADTDVYNFVKDVAAPTAAARTRGDQQAEKMVTLGRDGGQLVVTSIGFLPRSGPSDLAKGTVAVMIVHYKGQCDTPYGNDNAPVAPGLQVLVASSSGERIWEIAKPTDRVVIRELKSADTSGPWEDFQTDAAKYTTYPCRGT